MSHRRTPRSSRSWKWFVAPVIMMFQMGPSANLQNPPDNAVTILGVAIAFGHPIEHADGTASADSKVTAEIEPGGAVGTESRDMPAPATECQRDEHLVGNGNCHYWPCFAP